MPPYPAVNTLKKPPGTRLGSAVLKAFRTAPIIAQAGGSVHIPTAAGGNGLTNVPSGAIIFTARKAPLLRGITPDKAHNTAT